MKNIKCIYFVMCLILLFVSSGCDDFFAKPKSNDTSFTIVSVMNNNIENQKLSLTEEQYEELLVMENILSVCDYSLAEKATLNAELNETVLIFEVTAEDGTKAFFEVFINVLSTKLSIGIEKILDVAVVNKELVLSTNKYTELLKIEDLLSVCEYSLEGYGNVEVQLEEDKLKFVVSNDLETINLEITIKVLSNDTSLTVNKVMGVEVLENSVTLSTLEYEALVNSVDLLANCDYTLAEKATLSVKLVDKNLEFRTVAEDQTTSETTISLIVLSNMADIVVSKICDKEVVNESVIISTSDYHSLENSQLSDLCDYTASQGTTVTISLEEKSIKFTVVSEDNTVINEFVIKLTVLSNLAEMTINDSELVTVAGDNLECDENLINALKTNDSLEELFDFTLSQGATVQMTYDQETMVLTAKVTSEDQEVTNNYEWRIGMEKRFFAQETLNIGTDDAVVWDYEKNAYVMGYADSSVRAAYYYEGIPTAGLYYTFKVDVAMFDGISNGEFVVENVETGGSRIRYVIRYDGTQYLAFVDYQSYRTGWKGYRELKTFTENNITMEVVRANNWFVYLLNDEVIWKQEITFGATQIIVGGQTMESRLTNLVSSNNEENALARFEVLKNLYEPLSTGVNNYNVSQSNHCVFDEEDGVLSFNPTDAKVYSTFFYNNGTALAGQYYTFEGTFTINSHNQKIHPGVGLRILGSNGKVLRVYLRINTNWSNNNEHQITIDNGSGTESAGTQARIRYYSNSVKIKAVMNGKYTTIYVNDVMVFDSDGTTSKIANDPAGSSYKESTKILGVTGHRNLGFLVCGANVSISNFSSTTYTRVLSAYEERIQGYVDNYLANPVNVERVYAGSSFMEYWNTKHSFASNMEGVNVGLGGSHSSDWLQLIDRLITPYNPKEIVLYLGGNDASSQGNDMAPFVAKSIIRMINTMHEKTGADIYWLSLITYPSLNETNVEVMRLINDIISEYANECSYLNYVDIASFICPNGVANAEFYEGSDGVHMNSVGYKAVEEYLNSYFAK